MKVCKMGLESIWVDRAEGSVRLCAWADYRLGNLTEHSIEELWNGEKAQRFRESMLDGSYCFCSEQCCPYLSNNNLDTILVDYEVPEYPKLCNLSYEEQCNYVCVFCRKEHYLPKADEKENFKKIQKELDKFINDLDVLEANGLGELFCSEHTMNTLSNIQPKHDIKIALESNGSLFNEKNWNRISNLGNYDLSVAITVHSFEEATYQFLSGTRLPVASVIHNLHFIKKLREEGVINHFEIATVICERNFREMPEYVKRCIDEFEPDSIRLRFFLPYGVNSEAIEWFYDIRNPLHPYHEEFVRVMKDPIFEHEKVWKWQGDLLSEKREHPYEREHLNYMLLAKMIGMGKEKFTEYFKTKNFNRTALYCYGYVCRALIDMLETFEIQTQGMDILDSNLRIEETAYKDHRIFNPGQNVCKYDEIIVTSPMHFDAVRKKLLELNYPGEIINLQEIVNHI